MRVSHWPWVVAAALSTLVLLADLVASQLVLVLGVEGLTPLGGVAFAVVGALLVARGHSKPVGRLLVGMGLVWAVGDAAYVYLLLADEYPLPLLEFVTWLNLWAFMPMFALGGGVIALFPTGRPSQRATLWLLRSLVAVGALGVVARMTLPVDPDQPAIFGEELQANPWAVEAFSSLASIATLIELVYICLFALVVVELVVRWRRSRGVERLQMRWLAFGLVVFVLLLVSANVIQAAGVTGNQLDLVWGVVWLVGLGALPVTIGVAVARYRLYDIDRLISRTIPYALVVGTMGLVFTALVIGLPQMLGLAEGSPLLVAASTLAVAALFNPLRRRLQGWVDRRFNRARYDAQREAERFAERLRTEMELDEVSDELIGVVAKTMHPTSATVWIRDEKP